MSSFLFQSQRGSPRFSRLTQGFLLALVGGIASCAHQVPEPEPKPDPGAPKPLYAWYGEGVPGPASVKIDIDQQKLFLYKGGQEVGWSTVATGIYSFPTPTGNFKIQEKTVDKHSNLWGKMYDADGKVAVADAKVGRDPLPEGGRFAGARMPYWMRLTGDGIGMHLGPIPSPGRRASHGCIRVHSGFVKTLFREVSIGTPVSVVGAGPRWRPPKPAPKPKPAPAESADPSPTAPPELTTEAVEQVPAD